MMNSPYSSQPLKSQAPIGVFDSGVGGLSVFLEIEQQLPNEILIYFADTAFTPYGKQDSATLELRCRAIADFFMAQGCKAIVIACNTATAAMADKLRQDSPIPIIAIEPAIKPAVEKTVSHKIGVFATQNTLNSARYKSLKATYISQAQVFESSCSGFVEQVEKGELTSALTSQVVHQHLEPMLDAGVDTLVLGCTHYPFLRQAMLELAGNRKLHILETGKAVARQLHRILQEANLLEEISDTSKDLNSQPQHLYYSSQLINQQMVKNQAVTVASVMSHLLNREIHLTLALELQSNNNT